MGLHKKNPEKTEVNTKDVKYEQNIITKQDYRGE